MTVMLPKDLASKFAAAKPSVQQAPNLCQQY